MFSNEPINTIISLFQAEPREIKTILMKLLTYLDFFPQNNNFFDMLPHIILNYKKKFLSGPAGMKFKKMVRSKIKAG